MGGWLGAVLGFLGPAAFFLGALAGAGWAGAGVEAASADISRVKSDQNWDVKGNLEREKERLGERLVMRVFARRASGLASADGAFIYTLAEGCDWLAKVSPGSASNSLDAALTYPLCLSSSLNGLRDRLLDPLAGFYLS